MLGTYYYHEIIRKTIIGFGTLFNEIYVKHNTAGKQYDELFNTMKFDTFLSADQAVMYGLADKVVEKR